MNKIVYSFNKVTTIVPFLIALFVAVIYLFGGLSFINEDYTPSHFELPSFNLDDAVVYCVGVFLYAALFMLTKLVIDRLCEKEELKTFLLKSCVFLFLITISSRLLLILVLKNGVVPFSDFENVWIIANDDVPNLNYYSLFPSYLNYSVVLKVIIAIVGNNYISVIILNAILCGFTSIVVFLIAYNSVNNKSIANWSGVIYALMPSSIAYTLIGTPEFLTVTFNSYGLFFLLLSMKTSGRRKYVYTAIGGLLLGIGSAYKSFAIIIIIAYAIAFVFQEADSVMTKEAEQKKKVVSIAIVVCMIIITFAGYKIAEEAVLKNTEKTYNVSLDYKSAVPHFLLVGLNTQGEGQIHKGSIARRYVDRYLENGQNADEAKEYAMPILKADWRNNKEKIPSLFVKKIIWAWQDDTRPVVYLDIHNTLLSEAKEGSLYRVVKDVLLGLSQLYYIFVLLFAIIGITMYNKNRVINYTIETLLLISFGYFCLMLLVEAQGRYKCLIMPYVCILTAIGLNLVLEKHRRMKNG